MNDHEIIETLLNNYKRIKANIEVELNTRYPEYSLDSISFIDISTKGGDNRTSSIERYVIEKYNIPLKLQQQIKIRNIIRAAYDSLTRRQKEIVRERYFEKKTYASIGRGMYSHQTTISREIREYIIPALEEAGILTAWEIYQEIRSEEDG